MDAANVGMISSVQVLANPKDLDSRMLCWKGGSILGMMMLGPFAPYWAPYLRVHVSPSPARLSLVTAHDSLACAVSLAHCSVSAPCPA